MTDTAILADLVPVIVFLSLGIATAVASGAINLSPIVGYILLGLCLKASGFGALLDDMKITLLAQLGVIFLLFDIGLNFSLNHLRKQASNIFAFGPLQILFCGAVLCVAALLLGIDVVPSLLIGAVLALSSTAVVGRLLSERHQQTCPVGVTATSILIFQDIAAIFLLIIAGTLEGNRSPWLAAAEAIAKAILAFGITVAIARIAIGPLLSLVARKRNEEVFTAVALLIALAAGFATGKSGLSLTLGAFLGGVTLAETPYRAIIESEIRPFRGLLLGFFFISIGLSLDVVELIRACPLIIALTVSLLALKIAANVGASRIFRWSVPGSMQLGFLLAQGSEFAFVILNLPAVRKTIGPSNVSVIVAVVALSMAVTPNISELGRTLAGHMRRRQQQSNYPELARHLSAAPVIIVGIGTVGRMLADALIAFKIDYFAIERDPQRLRTAIADGYQAAYGDGTDMRLWNTIRLDDRKLSVLTAPELDALRVTSALAKSQFPDLKRFAVVQDEREAELFRGIDMLAILDQASPRGASTAVAILTELGCSSESIEAWLKKQIDGPSAAIARAKVTA
jgi:Kef-type K+ transport system membrane component KefB